jgi:acetyl-CoA carboxylase carboxyltransferase component
MFRFESTIQTNSPDYHANREAMLKKLDVLKDRVEKARQGGSPDQVQRHKQRGKLTARERLEALFDKNTPFLEFSTLAGYDMFEDEMPGAGIITGVGSVHGKEVLVVSNDATVKGGTYNPMTIAKHVRAQQIALENHLPCIYLVDSGGINLPYQSETFPDKDHFGRIFYNQSRLSAERIPQIALVMGSCTAGGAYVPALCDEVVIVKKQGTIFIGGPPLVKAATGVEVTAEELGGADVHCRISGVADHYAQNDEHCLQIARNIVENFEYNPKFEIGQVEPEDPYYDPDELLGIIPADLKKPFDIREVIARMVDGSKFQEFKELWAPTLVTGFGRIMGYPVGILGNNGVLFGESGRKGAHFIELCTERKIPLVFLQNITGFIVGKEYEHGGIPSDGAKMVHAVSNAQVPKFTVIVGNSYGAGNYAMCGRGYYPNQLWMWPNSKIAVMGGEQAANVLLQVRMAILEKKGKPMTEEEQAAFKQPILDKYEQESSAYYSTARLWDDGIIDPRRTRETLALGIAMALNKPISEQKYGVFRM